MLRTLCSRREWSLINAAVFGPSTVGELYDFWNSNNLDALKRKLDDVDLQDHIEGWQAWLRRRLGAGPAPQAARTSGHGSRSSAEDYLAQLRALLPEGIPALRSAFSRKAISAALARLPVSGSTARRYTAAWSSFFRYLVEIEVIDANPVRDVSKPRENAPRERWLSLQDSLRLVEAHTGSFRALAALREGAGIEVSACLRMQRRDVETASEMVHAHGTKNHNRDREVRVDAPFWPYVLAHVKTLLPDAELFPGVSYVMARKDHQRACEAISLAAYRLHDSRHSYAVRHVKAGDDLVLIAHSLGHANAIMVLRVYGKYRPTAADYDRSTGISG
jgi:integrase